MTTTCPFNLAALMRSHKVTIRQLAARTGFTLKRIREVRAMTRVPYPIYCDYYQAVTGVSVFSRARWDAMVANREAAFQDRLMTRVDTLSSQDFA